jgi:hypothetical protein
MKRRRFLQAIAAAPAAPLAAQQAAAQASSQLTATPPSPEGQPRSAGTPARFETTAADLVAQANAPVFFKPTQYAVLRRLGNLLQPAMDGQPGAAEAGAPEFLDFLIGVSPAGRQKLYQDGLDALDAQARKQFHTSFAELDDHQADAILRPLLVAIAWPEDLPHDSLKHFVAQAHRDFRAATENSREWAARLAASGRRAGRGLGGGAGIYWLPVDPVVRS